MKLRMMFIAFAVLLVGASALPAADGPIVTVNIPFEFRFGGSLMPAGEYSVRSTGPHGWVVLRQVRGKAYASVLGNPTGRRIEGDRGKLVFHQYGNDYFLRQVWIPECYGAQFRPSKAEKELASVMKQAGKTEVALLVTK